MARFTGKSLVLLLTSLRLSMSTNSLRFTVLYCGESSGLRGVEAGRRVAGMRYFLLMIAAVALVIGCKPKTVECVVCFEEVKIGAWKCKHCGEDPYGTDAAGELRRMVEWIAENHEEKDTELHENHEEKDLVFGENFYATGPWPWQRGLHWLQWAIIIFLIFFMFIPILHFPSMVRERNPMGCIQLIWVIGTLLLLWAMY